MQWVEMIRPRVSHFRMRGLLLILVHVFVPPFKQSILKPRVELQSPWNNGSTTTTTPDLPQRPQVVSGTARPHHKDALVLEWGQCLSHVVVISGVPVCLDRQLTDRNVRLRVHEHKWDPGAVVEAAFGIDINAWEAGGGEEILDTAGEVGGARGGVLELVHGLGEAVEVVDGVVAAGDGVDGGDRRLPVAGDDENGIGFVWIHVLLP